VSSASREFAPLATADGRFEDLRMDIVPPPPPSLASAERRALDEYVNAREDYSETVGVDKEILRRHNGEGPGVVEGENYEPISDRGLGTMPAFRKRLDGLLDNAGMGMRSHEQGVTNPN